MSIYVAVLVCLSISPPPPWNPLRKNLNNMVQVHDPKNNEKSVQDYEHKLNTKMKY